MTRPPVRCRQRLAFRRRRVAVALLGACLLAGCSNTFLYNQLDWLIPWYADDYVDLTRGQKRDMKARLEPLLRWHREEELANYVHLLDAIEDDLRRPLDVATVAAWTASALAAWARIEQRIVPPALAIVAALSERQVTMFIDTLRGQQLDYEKEYLGRSDKTYREENLDILADRLEEFLGRLSAAQRQTLTAAAGRLERFDRMWLADRSERIAHLEYLLQREPGWQAAAAELLATREQNRTPAYRRAFAHNRSIVYAAVAGVLNQRSHAQSVRLRKNIAVLRDDLRALMGAHATTAASMSGAGVATLR